MKSWPNDRRRARRLCRHQLAARKPAEAPAARGDGEAAAGGNADLGPSGPADRPCSPAPSAPGAPSRSAPSPATPRSASPRRCRPTASSGAATSARNGRGSAGATGRRPASRTASSSPSRPALKTLDGLLAQGLRASSTWPSSTPTRTTTTPTTSAACKLLRPGGLILIDNVLWGGSVVNLADKNADTKAIRALNAKLKTDERVDLTLFAVGDGMTCALKR